MVIVEDDQDYDGKKVRATQLNYRLLGGMYWRTKKLTHHFDI